MKSKERTLNKYIDKIKKEKSGSYPWDKGSIRAVYKNCKW